MNLKQAFPLRGGESYPLRDRPFFLWYSFTNGVKSEW